MFETEDSVLNYDLGEDQPSPSYWDEERLETEYYRLGFENAMMQVREQYELRRKKNQENSKIKTPKVTIKKRPNKTSKASAANSKTSAESFGKNKGKDNQNVEKQSQPASSTDIVVSAPDKNVSKPVHSEKSQADTATKIVANKT